MDLKAKITEIIKEIESINIEHKDVNHNTEDYNSCLNCLGESADQLHGIIYYIEKNE